jgi:hypothetical protein
LPEGKVTGSPCTTTLRESSPTSPRSSTPDAVVLLAFDLAPVQELGGRIELELVALHRHQRDLLAPVDVVTGGREHDALARLPR